MKNRKDIQNEFNILIGSVIKLEKELNLFPEKSLKNKVYTDEQYSKIKTLIKNKYSLPKDAIRINNSKDYIRPNGQVYKGKTNLFKLAKTFICQGYEYVVITLSTGKRKLRVHRLVAEAFLENPYNKPSVNHKDCNKLNNSVENLEWCTNSENTLHAFKNGLIENDKGFDDSQSLSVCKYDLLGKILKVYGSLREAAREENVPLSTIFNQCKNKTFPRKYKFYFRYK